MKVIVCKNYDEVSAESAKIVADVMKKKPNAVNGLRCLVQAIWRNVSSWRCRVANSDWCCWPVRL